MTESKTMVKIEASVRKDITKRQTRILRKTGKIPGNILEAGKSTAIELDPKWLSKAWQNGKKFQLLLGDVEKTVMIKELQLNPIKRTAVHVDLMYV